MMTNSTALIPRTGRTGLTLIEIMVSVLVLSIGLLGVIAAIPFGGFQMSKMQEADFTGNLARNAMKTIRMNDWANPKSWFCADNNGNVLTAGTSGFFYGDPSSQKLVFDFSNPVLIDPIGKFNGTNYSAGPATTYFNGNYYYTAVSPKTCLSASRQQDYLVEKYFYAHDDLLYGLTPQEEDTGFRPQLEQEEDQYNNTTMPAFNGQYTWMAMLTPQMSGAFYQCEPDDVETADVDIVVFKNRPVYDEVACEAKLDGAGYMGGSFVLNLSNGQTTDGPLDAIGRNRLLEQLKSTTHLLLTGRDDVPLNGVFRSFARWYKIANFAYDADSNNIYVTLIGPTCPTNWATNSVQAIIFPGVCGVYSFNWIKGK